MLVAKPSALTSRLESGKNSKPAPETQEERIAAFVGRTPGQSLENPASFSSFQVCQLFPWSLGSSYKNRRLLLEIFTELGLQQSLRGLQQFGELGDPRALTIHSSLGRAVLEKYTIPYASVLLTTAN